MHAPPGRCRASPLPGVRLKSCEQIMLNYRNRVKWMLSSCKRSPRMPNSRAKEPINLSQRERQQKELPISHVAIIMDGNRRWADAHGLPRLFGHKEGVKSLKKIVRHAGAIGLKYLTVYAFSSENWQRSREEVDYLFELFGKTLVEELGELCQNN